METSKKQNSRQQYASDFKEEKIRMLNSDKKVQELSKTFGIGENVLYNWNRIAEANEIKNKSQSQNKRRTKQPHRRSDSVST